MAYLYDVFISYPRRPHVVNWLEACFLENFEHFLSNSLPLDIDLKIFVDKTDIRTGDDWENRLKEALARSKCIIPIWLPDYFRSKWCQREMNVILEREKILGYRSAANPKGLVLPLNVFDGQHFPDIAKKINYFDCRDYYRVNDGYRQSRRFTEYLDKLAEWVQTDVANTIVNAPEWQDSWLVDNWLSTSLDDIETIALSPTINQPVLSR